MTMEILGTNFTISLGSWRLRFVLALEDTDVAPPPQKAAPPHRLRVIPDNEFARGN
jgi:hypothetical protein